MKKLYSFEDQDIPAAKDVRETRQLEPRTAEPPFERSNNELTRYTKNHPGFGALGDNSQTSGK